MERNRPRRLVFEGNEPFQYRKINMIGHSMLDIGKISAQYVSTIEEYESGCKLHTNCLGHMCITPTGLLLPPQSMALRTNIMKNDIYNAAYHAFKAESLYHRDKYYEIMKSLMAGKEGKMRSDVVKAPVDGSLRMVATIHTAGDRFGNYTCMNTGVISRADRVVFIPKYLEDKFKICRLDYTTGKYKSAYVKEGDVAYCAREPALDSGSNTLVRIYFWSHTALGIHPTMMKSLRGDYDGDEIHLYPVYSKESLQCAENWTLPPHPDFVKANELFESKWYPDKHYGDTGFMWHTTPSFNDIVNGMKSPYTARYNRMKDEHIQMYRERSDVEKTKHDLADQSIEGIDSINAQQHSQPIVGDMSRVARITNASTKQDSDGTFKLLGTTHKGPVGKVKLDKDAGNTSVRIVSRGCAHSQQIMLQAHRATNTILPGHNMVKDFIQGEGVTYVRFGSKHYSAIIGMMNEENGIVWSSKMPGRIEALCDPHLLSPQLYQYISNTYNPIILSKMNNENMFWTCIGAIEAVFLAHEVPASKVELYALATLFTYDVHKHEKPITTREGITARPLVWTETVMATSYHVLRLLLKNGNIEPVLVETISSALMTANFRMLY